MKGWKACAGVAMVLRGVQELPPGLRMDWEGHDRTEREAGCIGLGIGLGIRLDRRCLGIVRCLVPCQRWEAESCCDREREDSCLARWAV